MAQVIMLFVAVNVAAMFLLLVLSFAGSALALDWLEKLDAWIRRKEERR